LSHGRMLPSPPEPRLTSLQWTRRVSSQEPARESEMDQYKNMFVLHKRPLHPGMIPPDSRLATYSKDYNWPISPKKLVEAGLFSLGASDMVKCFSCGIGIHEWNAGEDPWEEHCRWSRNCEFLVQNKGPAFVEECLRSHEGHLETLGGDDDYNLLHPIMDLELRNLMKTSATEFYIAKGVPFPVLRMTIKRHLMEKGKGFDSSEELHKVLASAMAFRRKAEEEKEIVPPPREHFLCKICSQAEMGLTMLPCGHLYACPSCGTSEDQCSICRRRVEATVKTFIS